MCGRPFVMLGPYTRLVPGFVVDTRLEDGARVVTFGNGLVARELIVDNDVVWAVVGSPATCASQRLGAGR